MSRTREKFQCAKILHSFVLVYLNSSNLNAVPEPRPCAADGDSGNSMVNPLIP